jgi:hypothetical protein
MRRKRTRFITFLLFFALTVSLCPAQENERRRSDQTSAENSTDRSRLPREIRGYRIERAEVRLRRTSSGRRESAENGEDGLVQLGTPRVASLTPLGVWLEVPITIAAVEHRGEVEMLVFEDVRVDGTPVTIEEYTHRFRLPNDEPLVLPSPARIFMSVGGVLLGATSSALRETWPVTGRVYVCGRFRRFLFSFRRAVPVELNLSVANPLRNTTR